MEENNTKLHSITKIYGKDKLSEYMVLFNQFIIEQDINRMPIGLFYGRMGLCIYYYHQYRYYKKESYRQFAEKLLDSICDSANSGFSIDFETGLSGICSGIIYLIENEFIGGNPNYVLKEFDEKIFHDFHSKVLMNTPANIKSIIRILTYFSKRLSSNNISADERFIFENYMIRGVNLLDSMPHNEKLIEECFFSFWGYFLPVYLDFLYHLHQLDFYNYKIDKIIDELSPRICSMYPLLGSNRLYLGCVMEKISGIRKIAGWTKHIALLKTTSAVDTIINEEFLNKNILLDNGLAGFYYLLRQFNLSTEFTKGLILNKMINSEFWEIINRPEDLKKQSGLLNGISGLILICQDIINNN